MEILMEEAMAEAEEELKPFIDNVDKALELQERALDGVDW